MISIERVGNTGRAFRITRDNNIVEVRTRSPRRYLVVDVNDGDVEKRTDNFETADRYSRRSSRLIVVDAVAGEFRLNRFETRAAL